jgi:hypothetical protein
VIRTREQPVKFPAFLLFSAACLTCSGEALGQADDPILAKLQAARQAYDDAEATFRKGVLGRIDAAEERAVKAGKKAAVDQAVAEREAFQATGALPKSLKVGDLLIPKTRTRDDLQAAYTRAISELTKERRSAEAETVEREAATFLARFAGEVIKPGTVWRGDKRYLKGGPTGPHPFELRVTERNGDAFKGIIFEDGMSQSHDVEGTVVENKVKWTNTKTRAGGYPGQPQEGTIEGDVMKLHFSRAKGGGGFPVEAEATIKLLAQKKK